MDSHADRQRRSSSKGSEEALEAFGFTEDSVGGYTTPTLSNYAPSVARRYAKSVKHAAAGMDESRSTKRQATAGQAVDNAPTFEEPRSVTIDNRFKGVPVISPWPGFAVEVISKGKGTREVLLGPCIHLMEWDEELTVLSPSVSTRSGDLRRSKIAYLQIKGNQITDTIEVKTLDSVSMAITLTYTADFLSEYKDRWFSVLDYVRVLTEYYRVRVRNEIKNHTAMVFYGAYSSIVQSVVFESEMDESKVFEDNGMCVVALSVDEITFKDTNIQGQILGLHRASVIKEVEAARGEMEVARVRLEQQAKEDIARIMSASERREVELITEAVLFRNENEIARAQHALKLLEAQAERAAKQREEDMAVLRNTLDKETLVFDTQYTKDEKSQNLDIALEGARAGFLRQQYEAIKGEIAHALITVGTQQHMATLAKLGNPLKALGGGSVVDLLKGIFKGTGFQRTFNQQLQDVARNGEHDDDLDSSY